MLQVVGSFFIFGGILIAANKRVLGGIIAILAIAFLFATQDNPLLVEYLKPKPKSGTIRFDDLARHVSLLGAVLFFMFTPPVVDPVTIEEEKKKKKAEKED